MCCVSSLAYNLLKLKDRVEKLERSVIEKQTLLKKLKEHLQKVFETSDLSVAKQKLKEMQSTIEKKRHRIELLQQELSAALQKVCDE